MSEAINFPLSTYTHLYVLGSRWKVKSQRIIWRSLMDFFADMFTVTSWFSAMIGRFFLRATQPIMGWHDFWTRNSKEARQKHFTFESKMSSVYNISLNNHALSDLQFLFQVKSYEIVVKFFHISHNLTWYSAIVHKFTRIYPVYSIYELTKQFM